MWVRINSGVTLLLVRVTVMKPCRSKVNFERRRHLRIRWRHRQKNRPLFAGRSDQGYSSIQGIFLATETREEYRMQLGVVGLGRMGAFMAQRLTRSGHTVIGYVRHAERVQELLKEGSISEGATSLDDMVGKL